MIDFVVDCNGQAHMIASRYAPTTERSPARWLVWKTNLSGEMLSKKRRFNAYNFTRQQAIMQFVGEGSQILSPAETFKRLSEPQPKQ